MLFVSMLMTVSGETSILNSQIEVDDCQVGEPQKRKKGIFGIKGGDKEVTTV